MYKYNKIGVLNEKRCKELLFGSCYSFENIYVTVFTGSAGGSTGGPPEVLKNGSTIPF